MFSYMKKGFIITSLLFLFIALPAFANAEHDNQQGNQDQDQGNMHEDRDDHESPTILPTVTINPSPCLAKFHGKNHEEKVFCKFHIRDKEDNDLDTTITPITTTSPTTTITPSITPILQMPTPTVAVTPSIQPTPTASVSPTPEIKDFDHFPKPFTNTFEPIITILSFLAHLF